MKKKLLLKVFLFTVIATLVTFTSCKDYDDDISNLEGQISALKSEVSSQINAVKAELGPAMDAKIAAANGEITSLKTKLTGLEKELADLKKELGKTASQADLDALNNRLDAVKTEILEKTISLEVFNAFKTKAEEDLAELRTGLVDLETRLATAETELGTKASQSDLDALKNEIDAYKLKVAGELEELQIALNALDVRVKALEDALPKLKQELLDALGVAVSELEDKIAALRAELAPRIDVLEAILKVKDGESEVINDIYDKLGKQLDRIIANEGDIKDLQEDLLKKYNELVLVDEGLQKQITTNSGLIKDNKDAIDKINLYITNTLEPRLNVIEKDIKGLQDRMATAETNIGINTSNIFTLSRQLKGLTFIPTRGLPSEKTMKLYYFAGDYTANHTIMFRVSPSNAMLGKDFTIESLNYQITTRSASDGVNDASETVSVAINGVVTQKGDIIYVPVHVQGPKPCDVFGNIDWWGNNFFFGENVLNPELFPKHVVKTVVNPSVNYGASAGNEGLSLVLTALTESVEDGSEVYVKSTEMVNTELIPTQIKLAESDGKGNQIVDENLRKRLLNFTLTEAAAWANLNENTLPNNNKNWNVLTWSGNKGQGGVWTPGEVDLNDYVSSLFYPQDGGDFSRRNVVDGDPHRYLYAEFGKEFGKPYTDKPNYEKPVYEFEQMIYKDNNHNIVIGPKGGKDVTHSYAELDGSILKVFNNEASIQGVRNKKIIIKVTQVNSDCEERQPVGYLVLKYTDDPIGIWPDANHTVDLTNFPYYHKACEDSTLVGQTIPKTYTDGDVGATFTHRNALLELFTAPKFMSPINAPNSYGLSGEINPGDVNVILGTNLQLNGIGEHNMGNIYNIQRRDASVVPTSKKFKAAANNHINDPDN
ncbi:MAG: hypothetical protein GX670_11540, partial [Bacteroidales bacterium]|nr:hypothetical protein [Bacteroidales bacterium]